MAKNQRERIIEYIKENGSITTLEATNKLYIMCPWKRISELESKDGYVFDREHIKAKDRFGKPIRYIRYSLKEVG